MPLNVPEIVGPATASQGVTGTVKQRVQVREWTRPKSSGREATGLGLRRGGQASLVLTYEPTSDDTEPYEVPVNDGDSFETLFEEPSVRWFRTGEFLANAPFAFSNDVVLDLPSEPTRIYAVLRDGRGGVGWWWADLVPG